MRKKKHLQRQIAETRARLTSSQPSNTPVRSKAGGLAKPKSGVPDTQPSGGSLSKLELAVRRLLYLHSTTT